MTGKPAEIAAEAAADSKTGTSLRGRLVALIAVTVVALAPVAGQAQPQDPGKRPAPPQRGSSATLNGGSSADRYGGSSVDKRGVAPRDAPKSAKEKAREHESKKADAAAAKRARIDEAGGQAYPAQQ